MRIITCVFTVLLVLSAPPAVRAEGSDRSAVGTLDRVDLAASRMTMTVGGAPLTLVLERTVTIHQGSHTVKLADLPSHRGERVKVRYRESRGERRADWIVLAAPAKKK